MLIPVNFRTNDIELLLRDIEPQLRLFGFILGEDRIPNDAIACALDEIRSFRDVESRNSCLRKLEEHLQKKYGSLAVSED